MVDKTKQQDPGKLTAYERWELPNIGKATDRKLANTATQKLKPPTADDLEKIRQQAYEEGFEEGRKAGLEKGNAEGIVSGKQDGFKQGLDQGLEAGQSQISERVARLEQLLSELLIPLEKQQGLIEEAMLNVSMAVARAVIHKELTIDSSSIQKAINSILSDLPKIDQGFSLVIHPSNEEHVQPILKKYKAAINLKLDDSLTPGGCIFNSSSQLIDYTIEKRFQKTVQTMLADAVKGASDDIGIEVPSSIGALSDYPSETLSIDDSSHSSETKLETENSEIDQKESHPENSIDDASIEDDEHVQNDSELNDGSQDLDEHHD